MKKALLIGGLGLAGFGFYRYFKQLTGDFLKNRSWKCWSYSSADFLNIRLTDFLNLGKTVHEGHEPTLFDT